MSCEGGKKTPVGKRSKGKKEEADDYIPSKRYKDDFDQELEDDDDKMCYTSPPPTISHLSALASSIGSVRRDKSQEKPAELFRKDLISAMKLADSDQLQTEDYFGIQDPWRQDWERGVQVPVNLPAVKEASVVIVEGNENLHGPYAFKLPKKYLHAVNDETYRQGQHELHETQQLAEQVVRYDLDDLDVQWLSLCNEELKACGESELLEWQMERIMEELESLCYTSMQEKIQTVEGLGIEYDENVVCDVCRSPDSEDSNEMVFCDQCDICVHQACYGVQKIPEGNWLCRTCALGIRPRCVLCPRKGGAMKSTKSGSKWTHVSCALWIPEVSIGCPDKMEPITKISHIPSSRWSLICSVCRERTGACIQCCVKTCKTAFHVTCAFHNGLQMKTILDETAEDVVLKGYCAKHTKKKDGETSPCKTPPPTPRKESEMTEKEKTELRSHRLEKFGEEFFACINPENVACVVEIDPNVVDFVYAYWVLKRKALFNKQLLMPRREEADLLSKQREDSLIARMKMFIHLRQDLERVRNLCYMVGRREKVRRQLYRLKEEIFHKQVEQCDELEPSHHGTREHRFLVEAHKLSPVSSIYDQYDGILRTSILLDGPIVKEETEKPKGPGRPRGSGKAEGLGVVAKGSKGKSRAKGKDSGTGLSELSSDVREESMITDEEIATECTSELSPSLPEVSLTDRQDRRSRVVSALFTSPQQPSSPVTDAHTPGLAQPSPRAVASGSVSPVQGAQSPPSSDTLPACTTTRSDPNSVQAVKSLFTDSYEEVYEDALVVDAETDVGRETPEDGDDESQLLMKELRLRHEDVKPNMGEESLLLDKDADEKISTEVTTDATEEGCSDFISTVSNRSLRSKPSVNEESTDENVPDDPAFSPEPIIPGRKRRAMSVRSEDSASTSLSTSTKPLQSPASTPIKSTDNSHLRERQNLGANSAEKPDVRGTRLRPSRRGRGQKGIINDILTSSSLIVSSDIRTRVQEKLAYKNSIVNGGICKHAQEKLDGIARRRTVHDIRRSEGSAIDHSHNHSMNVWSSVNGSSTTGAWSSEGRMTRQSKMSDMESNGSDTPTEGMNCGRSSPAMTPDDCDTRSRSSHGSRKTRHFPSSLFGRSSFCEDGGSGEDSSISGHSDGELTLSEVVSESGSSRRQSTRPRRRTKSNLLQDDLSRDSLNSVTSSLSSPGKYTTRSQPKTCIAAEASSPFR